MRVSLLLAVIHGGTSVRVRHEIKATLVANMTAKAEAESTSGCGSGVISEGDDGQCQVGGEDKFFYCCNQLRACRKDANEYLEYYTKYTAAYESACGIAETDFRVSKDGQFLSYADNTDKICQPACVTDRTLQEKEDLDVVEAGIKERCDGKVEDSIWKPQLDGANWPAQKVKLLDPLWEKCGVRSTSTTTTTFWISTTATTTVTFTADEPKRGEVDMSFMGSDQAYQGHVKSGIWKFSSRKIRPDVKEEVTRNHFCANKGKRDETYYASSLCYWIPDIKTTEARTIAGGGLTWRGSLASPESNGPVCQGLDTTSGKCVKCSTCHNNAMSVDGKVSFTSFIETIPLSPECKTEKGIDRIVQGRFNATNRELIDNVESCQEQEAALDSAVSHHEQVKALIPALERLINVEIPKRLDALEDTRNEQKAALDLRHIAEYNLMSGPLEAECEKMINDPLQAEMGGYPMWWRKWATSNMPARDIVHMMQGFVVGDRPPRDHWNYVNRTRYWTYQMKCGAEIDKLRTSTETTSIKTQEYERTLGWIKDANDELAKRNDELKAAKDLEPILKEKRRVLQEAWDPVSAKCYSDYDELAQKRPAYMKAEIPTYYEGSCEQECVEKQSGLMGCGIIEGAMASDTEVTARGGVTAGCLPPYPSWIKGPAEWGADAESDFRQCSRIFNEGEQKPRHTQDLLVQGMLRKQGTWWTWQDRYFVLESGDQVRSAVMRYWSKDPKADRREPERVDKRIILWDAKSVAKSGDHCFKLYHFYRTYTFCAGDKSSATRDKWVAAIQASIRFPNQ